MKSALALLLIIGCLFGCQVKYESEIRSVDSLLVMVDSAKYVLHHIDSASLYRNLNRANEGLAAVVRKGDTLSREDGFLVDEYYRYRKAYNKWAPKLELFYEEIEVIRMQLEDLKTDLSNEVIEKPEIDQYIADERLNAELIYETIVQMDKGLKGIAEPFEECDQKIRNLMEEKSSKES